MEQITLFISNHAPEELVPFTVLTSKVCFIIISCLLAYYVLANIINKSVRLIAKKSSTQWDDLLIEHKVFDKSLKILPLLVLYMEASLLPNMELFLKKFAQISIIFILLSVFGAIGNAFVAIYRGMSNTIKKPIKGYVQIAKILINIIGYIFIVSIIIDKNPSSIIAGLGAMTAILILVFKDSILGLIASIQISSYGMVKLGDWIEMPKFGADGDVIDISLHTIKVQNWDKTISTIPTYAMISDSFKNWRGMTESGGRRIKRSIHIDMDSIKFCNGELLQKLSKIDLLDDYIKERSGEIETHNKGSVKNAELPINGRCLTNVGLFRQYITEYLRHHEEIHKGMTFLVRQLQPTRYGAPIEIYVFSRDQNWVNYEAIQADIFDHLYACIKTFELHLFQDPTGSDFKNFLTEARK